MEDISQHEGRSELAKLGEFGLISRLRPLCDRTLYSGICGIGDDCAVIPVSSFLGSSGVGFPKDMTEIGYLLSTADSLVSGIHFLPKTIVPYALGAKAIAVNLSDIAAMGAVPISATVCLHLPPDTAVAFVEELYRGMCEEALTYSCAIVGGDTVRADELAISISVLGFSPTKPLLRSGAMAGDDLWVSGHIGLSGAGLKILLEGKGYDLAEVGKYTSAHTRPVPRLSLGQVLREAKLATACIDISDGLLQDVGHICRMSGACAVIDPASVPVTESVVEFMGLKRALVSGEDYELAFSAPQAARNAIYELRDSLSLPGLSRIGEMRATPTGENNSVYIVGQSNSSMPNSILSVIEYLGDERLGFRHF